MPAFNPERARRLLILYLSGLPLAEIGEQLEISRQRVQQLVGPPHDILQAVGARAGWKCQGCGIPLHSGQLHDQTAQADELDKYDDPDKLSYLCVCCHKERHLKSS